MILRRKVVFQENVSIVEKARKRSESSRTDMNNALCCSTVDEAFLSAKINDECMVIGF